MLVPHFVVVLGSSLRGAARRRWSQTFEDVASRVVLCRHPWVGPDWTGHMALGSKGPSSDCAITGPISWACPQKSNGWSRASCLCWIAFSLA